MSKLLGKAGMKLFEKHLEQYTPVDPLYEVYKDKNGREKRRKRELPPGLSKRDAKILKSVKKRAHRLDKGFSLCGFRFGWTFFVAVIPGAGDIVGAGLNYFLVVRKSRKAEIPPWLLRQMLFNNAVSAGVSLVPIAGDIVLAMYKANSRNAALLEEFLRIRGEEFLRLQAEGKDVTPTGDVVRKGKLGKGKKPVQGKDARGHNVPEGTKGEMVAKGVYREDVEDVKPGAGREANEIVPGTSKPAPYALYNGKAAKGSTAAPATTETVPGPGPSAAPKRSFFGSSKKQSLAPPATGDRGRFVENVSSGSGSASGGL